MPVHNLLEYCNIYSMTSRSLWNCYRDEINDDPNENNAARNTINNNKTIASKLFECKTKLFGRTPNNKNILDAEVAVPLKDLSPFWGFLDLLLINSKIELDMTWSKYCIISEISVTPAIAGNPKANPLLTAMEKKQTNGATFQINNKKFYVPIVTLSIKDNIKFLEN